MKHLKQWALSLSELRLNEDIYEKLSDIASKLIKRYKLEFDDGYLIPIWLEPYYFYPGVFEEDKSMDAYKVFKNTGKKNEQFNNHSVLYFKERQGIGGITIKRSDIPLSFSDDYALSFLIKIAIFVENGKDPIPLFQKQIAERFGNKQFEIKERYLSLVKCYQTEREGLKPSGVKAIVRDIDGERNYTKYVSHIKTKKFQKLIKDIF